MRRVPPGTSVNGLVEALLAVSCKGGGVLYLGPEEEIDLLLESGAAGKESCGKPEKLPASLFTCTELVVCELLNDLTVYLISEWLLGERWGR